MPRRFYPPQTYDQWRTAGPDEPPDFVCQVCDLDSEDCTCDEPTPPYVPDEMDRADVMRDRMKDEPRGTE